MRETKAEILLHPVRLKIVQEFLGLTKLTAKDLVKRLPSISQATLYRHLDKLVHYKILEVVEENPIRGTVEKVYRLNLAGANVGNKDFNQNSREEQMNFFMIFIAHIMSNYESYLSQEEIDPERDGVGYRQAGMYLSDEEFIDFLQNLSREFQKVMHYEPSPERKKRIISTIIMPEVKRGNKK